MVFTGFVACVALCCSLVVVLLFVLSSAGVVNLFCMILSVAAVSNAVELTLHEYRSRIMIMSTSASVLPQVLSTVYSEVMMDPKNSKLNTKMYFYFHCV